MIPGVSDQISEVMPKVASYCTTFLKPEMLHIYRQVTGLKRFRTFVVTKSRQSEDRFPFDEVEMAPKARATRRATRVDPMVALRSE